MPEDKKNEQEKEIEEGRICAYPAEQPSSFHKGQLGKGVSIGGKVTAKGGSPVEISDTHISKLKKEWGAANRANGRFPPF